MCVDRGGVLKFWIIVNINFMRTHINLTTYPDSLVDVDAILVSTVKLIWSTS